MILRAFTDEYFRELRKIRKNNIIFFNGCFDILHLGHYEFLNSVKDRKRRFKDLIICGLNSDKSVKLQNKSHPLINNESSRALALKKLGVDYVIIFDEKTPLSLLMSLVPDIRVTSSEYKYTHSEKPDDIEFCLNHGIYVSYVDKIKGYSTTSIYEAIEEKVKEEIRRKI